MAKQKSSNIKKPGGGTAVGGGINFQAAVTAIVGVHILRGIRLGWLEGVCNDYPVAVWAESEGPGDDLRIELDNDSTIEVQVKKGLTRNTKLWAALLSIVKAVHKKELPFGTLIVSSSSSETIKEGLAKDIERLGQGRTDLLTEIGKEWLDQLNATNIPHQEVCRCIRIQVIHAIGADNIHINTAKEYLRYICARENEVDMAWDILYRNAVQLIEKRGRWVLQDLLRLLKNANITIRESDFPASTLDRLTNWVIRSNSHFSITGVQRKIPLQHLLPMHVEKMQFENTESGDLSSALQRYHKDVEYSPLDKIFNSKWIARFIKLVVVVAGPGLGKSTMMKELAQQYAFDGYLVLSIALKPVAVAIQQGKAFSEILMTHSLSGSGISPSDIKGIAQSRWVVLADGLDECGSLHHNVAENIHQFAVGHPTVRIIVTTRPIGYETSELSDWTHYRLLPPLKHDGADNISKLVNAVALTSETAGPTDISQLKLKQLQPSTAISISPQLLGMSAALILQHRTLPSTRLKLYSELIRLFGKLPTDTSPEQVDTISLVIDVIGWKLLIDPLITFDRLIEVVAENLAPELEVTQLTAKKEVRTAVTYWETVGLVERICHNGIELLTFIHKTFCEFVGSRFLVRHSQMLLGQIIDQPDKQEVINFAVGQGLADELIELYLRRHTSGKTQQLQPALMLLEDQDILVSEGCAQILIEQSFKAIENGVTDKFSIGMALSDLAKKARNLVEDNATSRLNSSDAAVRLVAWAVAVNCSPNDYDAITVAAQLKELLPNIATFNIQDTIKKKDLKDRDLVQRIALAALEKQPNDKIRYFAAHELNNKNIQTVGFMFNVNEILKSRGVEELPSPLSQLKHIVSPQISFPIMNSWENAFSCLYRTIAEAFIQEEALTDLEPKHSLAFPHFSALISASGAMETPASDIYSWSQERDKPAAYSTIKVVAALIHIDMHALKEEAKEIFLRLNCNTCESIHELMPAVDIPPPNWQNSTALQFNHEEVKRALLHTSAWINELAKNILEHIPMTRAELEKLLGKAKGFSLHCILFLITRHHFEDLIQMTVQRLSNDTSGDVSGAFDLFRSLAIPPSTDLINATMTCLLSDDTKTFESVVDLLEYWFDEGYSIDKTLVENALNHWRDRDEIKRNIFTNDPLKFLIAFLEKIDSTQVHQTINEEPS